MKNLIAIMTMLVLMLVGCGEETKQQNKKVLTEYEQGYKYGKDLYSNNSEFTEIADKVKSTKSSQQLIANKTNNLVTSSYLAGLAGQITIMCKSAAFGDNYDQNKIEFARGVHNGCIDHYNSLLR